MCVPGPTLAHNKDTTHIFQITIVKVSEELCFQSVYGFWPHDTFQQSLWANLEQERGAGLSSLDYLSTLRCQLSQVYSHVLPTPPDTLFQHSWGMMDCFQMNISERGSHYLGKLLLSVSGWGTLHVALLLWATEGHQVSDHFTSCLSGD